MIEVMKEAALAAGSYMLNSDEREQTNKTNTKDFVTVADIKSQDIIRDKLRQKFPDTIILSEEDTEEERRQLYVSGYTGFVLDPIDGTYNFKRDMKESAISIGYIELYWANAGSGAYLNDRLIHVSSHSALSDASVSTSNSYDGEAMKRNLQRHLAIYEHSGEMPWTACNGSGVLIWAWVASGRTDAYHHNGLRPWDNAAAFCIASEAGARISRLDGTTARFTDADILVATPGVYGKLCAIFDDPAFDKKLLR
ncbi:MAG: Inositol monophosphatase/fructose-1,6-bisphosphatase family protein [Candidatus Saccharibacteria bacterium GW2011_GWC2_48_9]|nr:MAG: Inositol monophosphatase/fructose-1,6-bisphosphatase family protein [Candidatus Saccharibacteria bacterium GW2011_GWC2_48_9]